MSDRVPTSPVAAFLGVEEARGGALALLRLSPQSLTDEQIVAALDAQIARVNAHPQRDTPEADEVRLALHAAAAQLLDPAVRAHLLRGAAVASARRASTPGPLVTAAADVTDRGEQAGRSSLERTILLALGSTGGWNSRTQTRILALAHAEGFTTDQVVHTLRRMGTAGRAIPTAPRVAHEAGRRRATDRPPGHGDRAVAAPADTTRTGATADWVSRDASKPLLILAAIVLVTAFVLAGLVFVVMSGRSSAREAEIAVPAEPLLAAPRAPTKVESVSAEPPLRASVAPEPSRTAIDPADVLTISRDLQAASGLLASDRTQALDLFVATYDRLGRLWPRLPPDQLVASTDAVVEFLYRVSPEPTALQPVVDRVIAGASGLDGGARLTGASVLPTIWAKAMQGRLVQETDLPPGLRALLGGAGRAGGPVSARTRLSAAVAAVPARLVADGPPQDVEAWANWAFAVGSIMIDDVHAGEAMLLAGLETLLTAGPEADDDASVSVIVGDLVERLAWREDSRSRAWVMGMLTDTRCSAADVRTLTAAIATRSSAPGVDTTMVLSASADAVDRAELRERFGRVWGIAEQQPRSEVLQKWRTLADAALAEIAGSGSTSDSIGELVWAVRLNIINRAGAHLARGDAALAVEVMESLEQTLEEASAPPGSRGPRSEEQLSAGAWAERYLQPRLTAKQRRDLLAELGGGVSLGAVDAEVLVGEAVAAPTEIRSEALDAVRRLGPRPVVLNAVLERLPRLARTSSSAKLIEQLTGARLPAPRDAAYPLAARRALVQTLLDVMARDGDISVVDRLSGALGLSMRASALGRELSTAERSEAVQPSPAESARGLYRQYRLQVAALAPMPSMALTGEEVDRRRAGRLRLAHGGVQEFAAEQAGVVELLAIMTVAHRPSSRRDVESVLESLAADRRRAGHVFEQLRDTEAAMMRLWMIRLMQEAPS